MKENNYILLLFTFLLFFVSCSSTKNELIPTSNKGGYKISIIEENTKINPNELTIKGKVFDVKTGNRFLSGRG